MTPSKPEKPTVVTEETTPNDPTDPKEKDDGNKSVIPGLTEQDRLKSIKKKKRKCKQKKEDKPTKKSDEMSSNDFLICPKSGMVKGDETEDFEFDDDSDGSDESEDSFEDSKEDLSNKEEATASSSKVNDEFLTPVSLKESFARTLAKSGVKPSSTSTPSANKRPSGSPGNSKDSKKSRASLFPKKK